MNTVIPLLIAEEGLNVLHSGQDGVLWQICQFFLSVSLALPLPV